MMHRVAVGVDETGIAGEEKPSALIDSAVASGRL